MRVSVTKAIRDRIFVGVRRRVEGVDDVDGFVMGTSTDWVLVWDCNRLMPDGFYLFRKDTIASLQRSKYHQFKEQMMERAGLLMRVGTEPDIDLTSIKTLLEWFIRTKRLCILRTENADKWWSIHCAIVGQSGGQLQLCPFDGAGRWDKVIVTGRWKSNVITSICFDGHYLRLYEKHLPRRPNR